MCSAAGVRTYDRKLLTAVAAVVALAVALAHPSRCQHRRGHPHIRLETRRPYPQASSALSAPSSFVAQPRLSEFAGMPPTLL